jgi:3-oxoacyl-[acyl-carrier protein] reductase
LRQALQASGGIGGAISSDLAKSGFKLVVNYAGNAAAAESLVSSIKGFGGEAISVQADVSDAKGARYLFDAAEDNFGQVSALINNAGIANYALVKGTLDQDFDDVFRINVRGVFLTMREASTRLADNGRVINISSSATRLAMPTYGPYSASKAAVEQMTRVYAKEVGARGITANSISPGPTETPLFVAEKSPERAD